tara:strand:+ start:171 stop:497 length:327 start_codon:yes stop_codon:yes gene_type:complete
MKYLLFNDAADDAAMFPASGLRAATCAADGTVLLQFAPGIHDPTGTDADADLVTLTVTADKQMDVFKAIAQAINGGPHSDGVVTVCDDVNSVFLHANILSCTITLNAI